MYGGSNFHFSTSATLYDFPDLVKSDNFSFFCVDMVEGENIVRNFREHNKIVQKVNDGAFTYERWLELKKALLDFLLNQKKTN